MDSIGKPPTISFGNTWYFSSVECVFYYADYQTKPCLNDVIFFLLLIIMFRNSGCRGCLENPNSE